MTRETYGPLTESVASADPAVAAELTYTADTDMVVCSLLFTLVTDANVANRFPTLVAKDASGNEFWRSQISGAGQAASSTAKYTAWRGAPLNQTQHVQFALPEGGLELPRGGTLTTVTPNKQVGDDYSAMRLQIKRW